MTRALQFLSPVMEYPYQIPLQRYSIMQLAMECLQLMLPGPTSLLRISCEIIHFNDWLNVSVKSNGDAYQDYTRKVEEAPCS
jgi:hypothetical protein